MDLRRAVAVAARAVERTGSRDPFEACREHGAGVRRAPLGPLKGFSCVMNRIRSVVLSDDLDPNVERIVCAHELGHLLLHSGKAGFLYGGVSSYSASVEKEREADLFAAEFLLDDGETIEAISEMDVFAAARALGVTPEVVDFKISAMRVKGSDLVPPGFSSPCFLKSL